MRLTSTQVRTIREKAQAAFGPRTRVRLFGSRTDDAGRGGDIDLFVETDQVLENRVAAASRLAAELQIALGDQSIDVILVDLDTAPQPIHDIARSEGILL